MCRAKSVFSKNSNGKPGPIYPIRRKRASLLILAACAVLAFLNSMQVRAVSCTALGGNFCTQAANTISGAQNVTVTAKVAGTVSSVQVLTLGVTGLDFAPGGGALCATVFMAQNATCTESVTFTPAYPGLRMGAVVLLDSGNNVLGMSPLWGTGVGGLGVLRGGNTVAVAGDGVYNGDIHDGSQALAASLNHPSSLALDGVENLYIADRYHHRIRKVAAATGIISTVAGNGSADYTGDGSVSSSAGVSLDTPWGVALDGAGNLYIADTGNNVVREIVAASGIIQTIAGTGAPGGTGDGGLATAALLDQPQGVSVDSSGMVYIADTLNHRIRKIDATGHIGTIAGTGTMGYAGDGGQAANAQLNLPFAVAFDGSGNMYIPDSANNVVRVVNAAGIIATFAGSLPGTPGYSGDSGPATAATLFSPSAVATDPAGNVYIADTQNRSIRLVNESTGLISTFAQNAISIYVGNNIGPFPVDIYGPLGLAVDGRGDVYFADSLNMRIQQISSNRAVLDYTGTAVRQGSQSTPLVQTIENEGNAPLNLASVVPQSNAVVYPAGTTCNLGLPYLAVDGNCQIGMIFAPSSAGNPLFGHVSVADAAVNSPLDVVLAGNATLVTSTTTNLTSNPNPSGYGAALNLIATVATGAGTGDLTGTVSFFDGPTALIAGVKVGASSTTGTTTLARAYFTTQLLTVGSHAITGAYVNTLDPTHFPSTSSALTQLILENTNTQLSSSANPSLVGQSVTLTAHVAASGINPVAPDGTVTFNDGSTILCTSALSVAEVATCTVSTLTVGMHSISATYNGDPGNQIAGSTSFLLRQDVQEPSATTLASSANPSQYGTAVVFTVSVTSNSAVAPTGTVNLLDGGRQIAVITLVGAASVGSFSTSTLSLGPHILTAFYLGDVNNSSSTAAALTQTVVQVPTTVQLSANPDPGIAGKSVALTAAVKVTAGSAIPSGLVSFADTFNGAATSMGSAALAPDGTVTIHPILAVGPHSIVARYGGDANDSASASAPLVLNVIPATTSIVVTSAPNPSVVEAPVTFTAQAGGNGGTATGSVSFYADGVLLGTAPLDAQGASTFTSTGLAAGTHSVTASYPGDSTDQPSTSPAIIQVVGTISTVTALGASTTTGANAEVILLATVVGSSGPVPTGTITFTVGATQLGSAVLNANGVATLTPNLAVGDYSIVASYPGDTLHSSSQSPPVSVSGTATSFNVTVTPPTLTLATTQNALVAVDLASFDNFSDTVGLGCSSLPAGVTCHFANDIVSLTANTTLTVQLTIDTDRPLSGGSTAMTTHTHGFLARKPLLAAMLLPLSIAFGCLFFCLRKRTAKYFTRTVMLLLACAALYASGCSNFTQASAAPGTYVIQVNATGLNSNLSHYQNVTLTITK